MATLKAPLFSLGASGKLGGALVFLPWKGLNNVRTYVIPTNPKSTKQTTQRTYLTTVVTAIHTAEKLVAYPLTTTDEIAESLLGSNYPTPRTWFNTITKKWLDQQVASKKGAIYRSGGTVATSGQIVITLRHTEQGINAITAGTFYYGITKTNMTSSIAATFDPDGRIYANITGLTNKTKYFIQFQPTLHTDFIGCNSGIYSDIPKA